MMTHFGPTRAEMKFRLCVSLLGLCLVACGLLLRGFPGDPQIQSLLGVMVLCLFPFSG